MIFTTLFRGQQEIYLAHTIELDKYKEGHSPPKEVFNGDIWKAASQSKRYIQTMPQISWLRVLMPAISNYRSSKYVTIFTEKQSTNIITPNNDLQILAFI